MLLRRLLANRPRQQTFHPHPRLRPQNPPKPPLGRPPLRLHCTRSDSYISKGASPRSNLRSPPLKHAYALPHSSPSTPLTTNSNSPQPSRTSARRHRSSSYPPLRPPPHTRRSPANFRQHHTKKHKITSPLSPTGRLWDPPLRGRSRRSSPQHDNVQKTIAKNEPSQPTPRPSGKRGSRRGFLLRGG